MPWISYAQNAEDVMLRRAFADLAQGFYVDVGANDPRADSVTRAFYERGWSGINLEPVGHWLERLQADRPRDLNLQVAAAAHEGLLRLYEVPGTGLSTSDEALAQRYRSQGHEVRVLEVPARRLDDILREAGVPQLHFLKIDVEGAETEVLRGLDLDRVRPWIVLVEATEPGSTAAAHAQWEPLLTGRDYDFVWFDGLNRFYLAAEHRARRSAFASPPNVFDDYVRYSEWLARQDVATLGRELGQARAALEAATQAAAQADASARSALAERDAVYASRSWRLTAPLRRAGGWARRLLGRGPAADAGDAPWPAGVAPQSVPDTVPASAPGSATASAPLPPPAPAPAASVPSDVAAWDVASAEPAIDALPGAASASASPAGGAPALHLDEAARRVFEDLRREIAWRDSGEASPFPPSSGGRPRLAFVSPLPPARSGVADYAARLLPALSAHYEIELVVEHPAEVDPSLRDRFPLRDLDWFERHGRHYDRRLYHVGNSLFHARMPGLLARYPGTVALHDVVLSDLLDHLERTGDAQGRRHPHAFLQALYRSHGYPALAFDAREGRAPAVRRYAASGGVVEDADGVIVHSAYAARALASGYGCTDVRVSALAREAEPLADRPAARTAARARLGLSDDHFLVCSFGVVAPSKLAHRLLDAWFGSALGADPRARLVFVGDNDPGAYGAALQQRIAAHAAGTRVAFTGYAAAQAYADHLLAADLAVQLRTDTRGESSGAVLDCLANGVPLVVNAHGTAAELPGEAVALLDDRFADADLVEALQLLRSDEAARTALAQRGRACLARAHHPGTCARQYRDAIEHFAAHGPHARRGRLVTAAAACLPAGVGREDLAALAGAIAAQAPRRGRQRLFVDITAVAVHDLRSGIQRVVRAVLVQLLEHPPEGWRVEPVYQDRGGYRHARRFTLALLGADPAALEDDPAEAGEGDVFLGLDLVTDGVRHHRPVYQRWRARGARVHFVVYDLLPVLHPEWFPDEAVRHYHGWLASVCESADGLVCISRAVRDELAHYLATPEGDEAGARLAGAEGGAPAHRFSRPDGEDALPRLGWFHLGGDLEASLPSRGASAAEQAALACAAQGPAFLMVGTVEPRKGHAQALAAFERLWSRGADCRLLIVGRAGWMVAPLLERLRAHPELGRRLFWFEDASDELLEQAYRRSAALLLASEGEGFGLPLIEAARHGLPVIARDLPVFREVAAEHAWWFSGPRPQDLADAVEAWLARRAAGQALPDAARIAWLGWAAATQALLAQVLAPDWLPAPGGAAGDAGEDSAADARWAAPPPPLRPHVPPSVDVQGSP